MKFVLFDIDGTLLDSGGVGVKSLDLAFEEMFSIRDAFASIGVAGKTDLGIIREGLRLHGVDRRNGAVQAFFEAYLRHLRTNIDVRKGHIKKGVKEALDSLTQRRGCVLGLLTGNLKEGARIKLEAFGLLSYFEVGAFGDDDEDRNRLLPLAIGKLVQKRSVVVSAADCFVVGDTPRDVECAKRHGARAIGVATGPFSSAELVAAGADSVFEDLADTKGFLSVLGFR